MRRIWSGLVVGAAMAAVVGCSRPPNAQIEEAQLAYMAATEADAATYAAEPFEHARAAHEALETELREQESNWLKSYERVGELAASLKLASNEAEQAATAGRDAMRDKASMAIGDTTSILDEVRGVLARTPSRRAVRTAAAAVRAELPKVEMMLSKADDALQAGQLVEAERLASDAREAAQALKTRLG